MNAQPMQDRPLEERLTAIPPAQLRPEVRQHLIRVCRAMDRLARLDEASQEAYVDEAALRNLLKDGLPPAFVDRYVDLMPTMAGGQPRGVAGPGHRRGRPILWQTYV